MNLRFKYGATYQDNGIDYYLSMPAFQEIVAYYRTQGKKDKFSPNEILEALVEKFFKKLNPPMQFPTVELQVEVQDLVLSEHGPLLKCLLLLVKEKRSLMVVSGRELNSTEVKDGQNKFKGVK
jgi:hypothetical protein